MNSEKIMPIKSE